MLDLILLIVAVPAVIVWIIVKMIEDIRKVFGYWIFPAALSLYGAVLLFIAGPAAPDAAFESIFNALSECAILGMRLPLWLLIIGVALLVIGAGLRQSRRSSARAN
ncbi:hypothetical protein BJG93_34785 (plasmid) [Paraburkholderia sprentiae WSM5005]|uniref:Uncharacterized protein n=1 Tax=Paraburkholderia sprentiae WSM5005 TaxID=754502 RepID=A0ACA8AX22_9BURK|nr:hypothetical protein [Paraburkholderia sprentiae]APA90281.1 hypothetical protein BJG93_34785 [Paraburkholderia sprentiae WSM5005]